MTARLGRLLRGNRGFLIVGGLPLLAVAGLLLWGIVRGAEERKPAGADISPPVVQLIRNTEEFLGQEVRVTARLEQVIGDRAYTIVPRQQGQFPPILVVKNEPYPFIDSLRDQLRPGSPVDVTGRFQRYVEGKFADVLGEDLERELAQRFAGGPAIVAWSTVPLAAPGGEQVEPQRIEGRPVSIRELAGAPERYSGRYVQIDGTVTRVLGPRLYVVEDRVLVADPVPGTPEGARVIVSGYVRTLPPEELADETGFQFDSQTLTRLGGTPSMPAVLAYNVQTPGVEEAPGGPGQTRRLPESAVPPGSEPPQGGG